MDIKFCKTNLSLSTRSWMGGSNSSSPSIGWPSKLLLPNPELTTVVRGENIDFRPPVYTLVGHEDDLREEEPELDRAEDRAESQAEDQSRRVRIWGKPLKDAKVHGQDGEQDQKFGEEGFWFFKQEEEGPMAPTFLGVDHFLTTPRRLPAQEPHRASSFEPREGEDNSQRRRKTSKARRSSSTTGLDRVQTEETQLDRADGRVDLEEPQFEIRDLSTIQRLTRTSPVDGTPMDSRASQLHQGQGSHTHFR
ncbi:unnamed protein product [Microthlaspi erraticum]|uniref:Arabidopsis retrotransposon Orf1 C-terminal domain-containing protein n=1 Tax=Microthlaspi erraticum TaxID=1685480 RepID=A0A6D2K3T2_9BRAS|nr:unnamed protein product [Microthlaspi erraticum]